MKKEMPLHLPPQEHDHARATIYTRAPLHNQSKFRQVCFSSKKKLSKSCMQKLQETESEHVLLFSTIFSGILSKRNSNESENEHNCMLGLIMLLILQYHG